jgi:hypothetical protein
MPIKVTCQCGKSFAAKDELAGKAVKCPSCQQPLRIPAATGAAAGAAPKSSAGKAPASAAATGGGNHDLFDEIGLKQHAPGTRPCPGCAEPLPEAHVVCVKCGYNVKLGRRMTTVKVGGGADEGGGHGAVATELLERAAQTIEEDQAEDRKKTGEGLPWWVYFVLLAVLVGFLATMMVMANKEPPKEKKDTRGPGRGPAVVALTSDQQGQPGRTSDLTDTL